jgi:hypothetical protein
VSTVGKTIEFQKIASTSADRYTAAATPIFRFFPNGMLFLQGDSPNTLGEDTKPKLNMFGTPARQLRPAELGHRNIRFQKISLRDILAYNIGQREYLFLIFSTNHAHCLALQFGLLKSD